MIVHRVPLDGGHVMHVEEYGNPSGLPALVLHGGPGSGGSPFLRSFFDPAQYRVICPDQRGAGHSTPAGCTADNTVTDLLADLRLLREHLAVARWLVVGGSWGATLALLHALDEPDAIAGLLLRNVFLARASDIDGFFARAVREGGPWWQALARQAEAEGCTIVEWLARIFVEHPPEAQRAAALCWSEWEQRMAGGAVPQFSDKAAQVRLVQRYRVQSHYLKHGCWLETAPLLERCAALPSVPVQILHGTEDAICPPEGALALAEVLRGQAKLRWVPGAGHDPAHPQMVKALQEALQTFARARTFPD